MKTSFSLRRAGIALITMILVMAITNIAGNYGLAQQVHAKPQLADIEQLQIIMLVANLAFVSGFVFLLLFIRLRLKQYLGGEPEEVSAVANKIAEGRFKNVYSIDAVSQNSVLGSLHVVTTTMVEMEQEMAQMEAGQLEGEVDIDKFHGAYREMMIGVKRIAAHQLTN